MGLKATDHQVRFGIGLDASGFNDRWWECAWRQRFELFDHVRKELIRWIQWYNNDRSHQSLGCTIPCEFCDKETFAGLTHEEHCRRSFLII